mmetsp:Transcript_45974/g.77282  ORF Transcript_45974/g.77282 Transcript_45974/m.77282 type:complete len:235 (+) Transcript_45974:345-1049(+)
MQHIQVRHGFTSTLSPCAPSAIQIRMYITPVFHAVHHGHAKQIVFTRIQRKFPDSFFRIMFIPRTAQSCTNALAGPRSSVNHHARGRAKAGLLQSAFDRIQKTIATHLWGRQRVHNVEARAKALVQLRQKGKSIGVFSHLKERHGDLLLSIDAVGGDGQSLLHHVFAVGLAIMNHQNGRSLALGLRPFEMGFQSCLKDRCKICWSFGTVPLEISLSIGYGGHVCVLVIVLPKEI